ncbi:hypothetical protein MHTCC0001_35520 [Flavobacteriaceae bacterium MHTCC 0001]
MVNKRLLLGLFYLFINIAFAQVEVKALPRTDEIAIDDTLVVEFKFNKIVKSFKLPNSKNYQILGLPLFSQRQFWDDGEMAYTQTYIYKLKPLKTGKMHIPPATAFYNSKVYSSNTVTVKVLSLREKVKQQTTAYWKHEDKSKLVLVDKNALNQFWINLNFDRHKFYFYVVKKSKVIPQKVNDILPEITFEDFFNISKMLKDGYRDKANIIKFVKRYYLITVKQPENNDNLIFELKLNTQIRQKKEHVASLKVLKAYSTKTITLAYNEKQRRFVKIISQD